MHALRGDLGTRDQAGARQCVGVVAGSYDPEVALFASAIRMHYNYYVLKTVRESAWSASHIAAHDVTLDEVREAILEHPYWSVLGATAQA